MTKTPRRVHAVVLMISPTRIGSSKEAGSGVGDEVTVLPEIFEAALTVARAGKLQRHQQHGLCQENLVADVRRRAAVRRPEVRA